MPVRCGGLSGLTDNPVMPKKPLRFSKLVSGGSGLCRRIGQASDFLAVFFAAGFLAAVLFFAVVPFFAAGFLAGFSSA